MIQRKNMNLRELDIFDDGIRIGILMGTVAGLLLSYMVPLI